MEYGRGYVNGYFDAIQGKIMDPITQQDGPVLEEPSEENNSTKPK